MLAEAPDGLLEDDLVDMLRRQIEAVDGRVTGGGNAFAEDSAHVRVAARRVQEVRADLGLGALVRSLTPPTGKPAFLLLFNTTDHGPAVLKVYGMVHPAEAASQRLWARHGVPTVSVYASGDEPTSWLLLEYVDGEVPPDEEFDSDDALLAATREMAEAMARAHAIGDPGLPGSGPLSADTMRRLGVVTGSLAKHGYPVPEDWPAHGSRLLNAGRPVLLHGDLVSVNTIRRRSDGRLCVYDASGLVGPAEFDAARWCVRMGQVRAELALAEWMSVETTLDPDLARGLLGLESLMEAGVNELVKDEFARPADEPDELTHALLRQSGRLLAD